MSTFSDRSELHNVPSGLLLDILVKLFKPGTDASVGVIREVNPVFLVNLYTYFCFCFCFFTGWGSCRVVLGSRGDGETITAFATEIEIVQPSKPDKVKIIKSGSLCGATGKLIGVDGTDEIVKVDVSLAVEIIDIAFLAKLAQP